MNADIVEPGHPPDALPGLLNGAAWLGLDMHMSACRPETYQSDGPTDGPTDGRPVTFRVPLFTAIKEGRSGASRDRTTSAH
jgi:hypothetical protein